MSLVSSNDTTVVEDGIRDAIENYRDKSKVATAIEAISKLRGIGPATASLLLAVHDPEQVIFFSDEAFYWICCDGKIGPIKYNAKEYAALAENTARIRARLNVGAVEIEKVAFVLMKENTQAAAAVKLGRKDTLPKPKKSKAESKHETLESTDGQPNTRRSKRQRLA